LSKTVITNCRVLTPDGFRDGVQLVIEKAHIVGIEPVQRHDDAEIVVDLDGKTVLPGFVDTQVNGGGGVLFNTEPTVEGIASIARAHARHGTTTLLPTFVTDDLDRLERAIAAVREAIAEGVPGIAGIHIEGPFLAAEKKGAHDASKFLHLSRDHIGLLTALKDAAILITVAPESAPTDCIEELVVRGAAVAIGHSNASLAAAQAAIEAGARGFTHLYNSMSPMIEASPGCVGAALSDDRTFCGIIADGVHVEPELLRIAYRCKGPERLMLVTDAMPCVGMLGERVFTWEGTTYRARDGACYNDSGVLSGSDLNMNAAVRNAITMMNVPTATAVTMATRTPAQFLGLGDRGTLASNMRADFVVTDSDLIVQQTWIGGIQAFGHAC
jgi:N-acetylglucosamine-6-phosphate deacetylase